MPLGRFRGGGGTGGGGGRGGASQKGRRGLRNVDVESVDESPQSSPVKLKSKSKKKPAKQKAVLNISLGGLISKSKGKGKAKVAESQVVEEPDGEPEAQSSDEDSNVSMIGPSQPSSPKGPPSPKEKEVSSPSIVPVSVIQQAATMSNISTTAPTPTDTSTSTSTATAMGRGIFDVTDEETVKHVEDADDGGFDEIDNAAARLDALEVTKSMDNPDDVEEDDDAEDDDFIPSQGAKKIKKGRSYQKKAPGTKREQSVKDICTV